MVLQNRIASPNTIHGVYLVLVIAAACFQSYYVKAEQEAQQGHRLPRPLNRQRAQNFLLASSNNRQRCGPKLTIITPVSHRSTLTSLSKISEYMNWDCIYEWVMVYDTDNVFVGKTLLKFGSKVRMLHTRTRGSAVKGNLQRNFGLRKVPSGLVYFLDDDNIIHPNFWTILPNMTLGHVTSFDQVGNPVVGKGGILRGDVYKEYRIDTAMFVADRALIGHTKWGGSGGSKIGDLAADGRFIEEIYKNHPDKFVHIPVVAAYYNQLKKINLT